MNTDNDLLKKIRSLPSLSPVLQRITATVANPDSSAADVVDCLKLDPAMVSSVFRLANSAYFGMQRRVSSLQNAVVLLGNKRIRSLALSASVLSVLRPPKSFPLPLEDFWRHSLTVALIAESIAKHIRRYHHIEPSAVFSGAIMHDIGKLVLAGFEPDYMRATMESCTQQATPFYLCEKEELSHTHAGGLLAGYWNFSDDLTCAMAYHHIPASTSGNILLVSIVHISDIMAHMLGFHTFPNETAPPLDERTLQQVPLPMERLRVIATDVIAHEKELETLMSAFSQK